MDLRVLEKLKETNEEDFELLLKIVWEDILFNRTNFGKTTTKEKFLSVVEISRRVISCL